MIEASTIRTTEHGDRPRVLVAGAGVCGLAVAWRLAEAGCAVAVFDRNKAGRGATWAAAGMLAGGVETEPGEEQLLRLSRWSQELWPSFRQELEQASGVELGYRDEGTLVVALNREEVDRLKFRYEYQTGLGLELSWLTGQEVRRREPCLRPGVAAGVFSPNDHQVDNRRLAEALEIALRRAGGELHENTPVEELTIEGGKLVGLRAGGALHEADSVVLALGAWSARLPGLPKELQPPVRPLKGQSLALEMSPERPLLHHVLWTEQVYLVPRADGRLIVGATVEERGFEEKVTAGGVLSLLEGARRALPGIEDLPLLETWSGLRPSSRDDAPILGRTSLPGLFMATGHHRNGILLAPATAQTLASEVLNGVTPEQARGFGLSRFDARQRQSAVVGA